MGTIICSPSPSMVMAVSAAGDVYSFTAEENGDYLISAADKNGNVTNQTVTVDKIDKTKPVIGTIQMSNPDVVELEKTLTFTVTDGEGAGVRGGHRERCSGIRR